MAEYGEWNRKGATLSDVTAQKEYGIDRNFIVKGIRAGKLEFREGSVHYKRDIWFDPAEQLGGFTMSPQLLRLAAEFTTK